jgi:hypothetical protein
MKMHRCTQNPIVSPSSAGTFLWLSRTFLANKNRMNKIAYDDGNKLKDNILLLSVSSLKIEIHDTITLSAVLCV